MIAKRFWATALTLALLGGSGVDVFASNPSARSISIFRIEGLNASLSRGTPQAATPREGQRLSNGNVLTTGADTNIYISLDGETILKMDEASRVAVSSSGNALTLSVQNGSALVHAAAQASGNSLTTRVGNTALTVRGTVYVMSASAGGSVDIVMLAGLGQVGDVLLPAGSMLSIVDDPGGPPAQITPLDVELLSVFVLESIWDNREMLLAYGSIGSDMLTAAAERLGSEFIEALYVETSAQEAAQTGRDNSYAQTQTPEPSPSPSPSPTPGPSPTPSPSPTPTPSPTPKPVWPPSSGVIPISTDEHFQFLANTANEAYLSRDFSLEASLSLPPNFMIMSPLAGTFEGNGHTLTLYASGNYAAFALFSQIAGSGEVRNLTLVGQIENIGTSAPLANQNHGTIFNVHSEMNRVESLTGAAGLVSQNYGHIERSSSGGTVRGTINVGGLVSVNHSQGEIVNSRSTASIFSDSGENVGGLVGNNFGDIFLSYATGIIQGTSNIGGLAGNNSGNISSSYANGDVSGTMRVGGIVGFNQGPLENSFSSGNVSGSTSVGGVVGTNDSLVSYTFATGMVSGNNQVGGIAGNSRSWIISNSVALNPSVLGTANAHRILGLSEYSAGLFNNYALGSMSTYGMVHSDAFGPDGETFMSPNRPFWNVTVGFDPAVWDTSPAPVGTPVLIGLTPFSAILALAEEIPLLEDPTPYKYEEEPPYSEEEHEDKKEEDSSEEDSEDDEDEDESGEDETPEDEDIEDKLEEPDDEGPEGSEDEPEDSGDAPDAEDINP